MSKRVNLEGVGFFLVDIFFNSTWLAIKHLIVNGHTYHFHREYGSSRSLDLSLNGAASKPFCSHLPPPHPASDARIKITILN